MNWKKVVKDNEQIKLFLDPALVAGEFDIEQLIREVELEVKSLGVSLGTMMMQKFIGEEVKQLIGERYGREEEKCYRWGKQNGYVIVGGQKVRIDHARVRRGRGKGEEVIPKTYERFQQQDERTRRVFASMLARVSCRDYKEAIESVQAGYGISKSVVSREVVRATSEQLAQLTDRRLDEIDVVVLIIDGVEVDGTVFVAALAIDREGVKHLLGFSEGATENADTCKELLGNLRDRGLQTDQAILAVIDGSKALRKGLKDLYGKRVLIHRCREHKIRNVLSHLPKKYHGEIERRLRAAYKMNDYTKALEAIQAVVASLDRLNDAAAASLREGMEEALTVHKLGLPETLRRSLITTNLIESAFSRYRDVTRNVKRWRTDDQKRRWAATALLEAQRSFRRVKGHRSMVVLIAAIESEIARMEPAVEAA